MSADLIEKLKLGKKYKITFETDMIIKAEVLDVKNGKILLNSLQTDACNWFDINTIKDLKQILF